MKSPRPGSDKSGALLPATSSRTVSASYAAKNFGALVDAVRGAGATYVVERSGQPVVHLVPAPVRRATLADLADLYREAGRLSEDYLREVEHGAARLNRPSIPRDPWAS
jgi:antitoxin (DNA-binding transcriptional repressor) of toxin-antitoxin stability system